MAWKDLSIREKADIIRASVANGNFNLSSIRNEFDDGSWLNKLEDVFAENGAIAHENKLNAPEPTNNKIAINPNIGLSRQDVKRNKELTAAILDKWNNEKIAKSIASGAPNDKPIIPLEQNIMDFTAVGDLFQAVNIVNDISNKRLKEAAIGAGLLFLPNVISKPIKNAASVALRTRRIPNGTISLENAINAPYKNTHALIHEVQSSELVPSIVKHGDSRFMSPSMGIVNVGDYNNLRVIDPLGYGNYSFIGDKSLLNRSTIYKGDGLTPTVATVYGHDIVPSELREEIANRITRQNNIEHGYGIYGDGRPIPTISVDDLSKTKIPSGDYFEAKLKGTIPAEKFQYGLFREPKSAGDEAVIRFFEDIKFPFKLYKDAIDKPNRMLDIFNERPDLLFASGGNLFSGKDKNRPTQKMHMWGKFDYPETIKPSANKYERISNDRYNSAFNALTNAGYKGGDADRLAQILASQSITETGWVDKNDTHNYAGYLNSKGKLIKYDSPEHFWSDHISNLSRKWPEWNTANNTDEYFDIVNHTNLGLNTLDKFNRYNKAHRDNPVYIYAPDWQNQNYSGRMKSVSKRASKYFPKKLGPIY